MMKQASVSKLEYAVKKTVNLSTNCERLLIACVAGRKRRICSARPLGIHPTAAEEFVTMREPARY
jgi:hypothetical protein